MEEKPQKEYAVDLHAHLTDGYDFEWFFGMPCTNKSKVCRKALEHCFSKAQNSVIGIVNFDDMRAEDSISRIAQIASNSGYSICLKEGMLSLYDKIEDSATDFVMEKEAHFITGQEIPTEKGHVLVVGAGKNIYSRKIEDVLKEARDLDGLIIADHPLAKAPFKLKARISLEGEDIERYKDYFDAMEIWNANYGHRYVVEQRTLALKLGIPGIAASDSHSVRDLLSAYISLRGLDVSSIRNLKSSLRQKLKEEGPVSTNMTTGVNGEYGPDAEVMRHMFSVAKTIGLQKIGLIRREKS